MSQHEFVHIHAHVIKTLEEAKGTLEALKSEVVSTTDLNPSYPVIIGGLELVHSRVAAALRDLFVDGCEADEDESDEDCHEDEASDPDADLFAVIHETACCSDDPDVCCQPVACCRPCPNPHNVEFFASVPRGGHVSFYAPAEDHNED